MPFLDWVNKNQAVGAANAVPYHLLQLVQNFGDAASTVNSQQSTVNSQQSTVNSQQSTVNSQQSTVNQ